MGMRVHRRRSMQRGTDPGMTLVELLVAMGIFVVVIAIFMSGIVIMTKDTARSVGVSDSTSTARKLLDRFDKQVRYSTSINPPGMGPTDGMFYVEYIVPSQTAGATPVCVQWRYNPSLGTMQVRTWINTSPPMPSSWDTIATNVRNALATNPPFVFSRASVTQLHQELAVSLDIGPGSSPGAQVATSYVARNTSVDSTSNPVGTLVCQAGVGRP